MMALDDASTNPTLLKAVADWRNHRAWADFCNRYDPLLRRWCRGFDLDADSMDEVCQRVWTEVADRMRTFRYDPGRTFRGWLRRVCRCRVIDLLRERQADQLLMLDDREDESWLAELGAAITAANSDPDGEAAAPLQALLRCEAEKVQAAVRQRVLPRTWDAFWLVAISDWTIERTAKTLEMTHTAVYAAAERVARMLREEGKRLSERWPAAD